MGNTESTLQQPNRRKYRKKFRKQVRRKQQGISKISEYSPYEIMALKKDCSLKDLKKKYKQLATIYHPDNGGNKKIFMKIVKSYNAILFEKESEIDNRIEAPVINKEYNHKNKNTINRENVYVDKDNFNNKKFNKVFRDYRIENPYDKGYGKIMAESEKNHNRRENINIERLTSLNKGNFNDNFNENQSTTIIKYEEPQALYSNGQNNVMELGIKNIDDFSGNNYTDYKKAYNNKFFNPNNVKYKTYKSVREYENARSQKQEMTQEEFEYHNMMKKKNEQEEIERRRIQREYDQIYEKQFNNLNKVFIKK